MLDEQLHRIHINTSSKMNGKGGTLKQIFCCSGFSSRLTHQHSNRLKDLHTFHVVHNTLRDVCTDIMSAALKKKPHTREKKYGKLKIMTGKAKAALEQRYPSCQTESIICASHNSGGANNAKWGTDNWNGVYEWFSVSIQFSK